jgi:Cd2+/Zn2+-exporting ATPase
LLPAAQPLFCGLFLVGGKVLEWWSGPGSTLPLYAVAYVAGGTGSALAAWQSLRRWRLDVNLLMLLAAAGTAALGQWSEGGVLLFLFSLSNALEFYAMRRTRHAIRALLHLRPATARVRRGAHETTVDAASLQIGDVVIVRPAERLPADGVVISGASSIDQSPITGESMPVDVAAGSRVFAGTINQRGSVEVRVTTYPQDTTLARIIALVERAQLAQAPTQRLIDRFGQVYAVLVLTVAALTYGVLVRLGWQEAPAFYRAITLLVVASPCAVMIATPAAMLTAIARGARAGVLFKGGAHVEQLARVKTVVFDKTGTLTHGRPVVTDVMPALGDAQTMLALAGAIEQRSEHALADAVVQACRVRGLSLSPVEAFSAVPGRGVRGNVGGRWIRVGSERFMLEEGVELSDDARASLAVLRRAGKTPILVSDDRLIGTLAVADTLRPTAEPMVRALRALGVPRLVLLTGDHREAAEVIGAQLGLDDVRAELLPEEKAGVVHAYAAEGVTVMVGDGVNDAPAIASATVGVAMGIRGTDAALETADVVLMGGDLTRLPYAIALSRQARRVVVQSLSFAALVITGLIGGALLAGLRLALGVVGHEGSTVLVVINGLRLLRFPSPGARGGARSHGDASAQRAA